MELHKELLTIQPPPGAGWRSWLIQMQGVQISDEVGEQAVMKHAVNLASVPLHEVQGVFSVESPMETPTHGFT